MSQLFAASELNIAQNYYPQQAPQYQNQPQYAPQPQYQAPQQNYDAPQQYYQQPVQNPPQNPYPAQDYQQPQYAPQGQYPAQPNVSAEPYYQQQAPQQYAPQQPYQQTQQSPQYQQYPQYQQQYQNQSQPAVHQPPQPQYAPPAQNPQQNPQPQQQVAPQNPPARQDTITRQPIQNYASSQSQKNGNLFFGVGILGGRNSTTFDDVDFKPDDFGGYIRLGRQYSIMRSHVTYSFIKHFGDDDDWVKVDTKQYQAASFIVSLGADLMPKLPSSPLYGILGADVGLEFLKLQYKNPEAMEMPPKKTILGANIGINAGFAVEITPSFQIEFIGRYSVSFLPKVESTYKIKQNNLTGRLGLNFVF